jgi:hypothetical protein
MTGRRVIEHLTRNAALGIRFWDVAEGTSAVDGLQVEVFSRANPRARSPALPNRSGVYVAHHVPGVRDFEFNNPGSDVLSPPAFHPYRVEVKDRAGRFLPMVFDADLPARGLFTWGAPWLSPPGMPALPGDPGSPPQLWRERVPLFSAPTRPVPDPLGVVHAQLREQGTRRELAWALLAVAIDGRTCGLGLANEHGQVAVMFPYPEPPGRRLASPPELREDYDWQVELTAFVPHPSSPPGPVPEVADLAEVLAALDHPRAVVESLHSPAMPLRLAYRQALTVRTAGAPGVDASYLLVSA